jgi:fumarylpyruvate hydrolase
VCGTIRRVADTGHPPAGRIRLEVNGTVRQDADLAEMIWSVPEIVSILSHSVHIMPGDLVFTGTPAGVGPLVPGDTCTVAIEGLDPISFSIGERAGQ